ncbi:MAG: hypothetical protein KDK64_07120 [Chlamydiia bacterium]|nr:hypothetical protein [Chlamydiia bacterium]
MKKRVVLRFFVLVSLFLPLPSLHADEPREMYAWVIEVNDSEYKVKTKDFLFQVAEFMGLEVCQDESHCLVNHEHIEKDTISLHLLSLLKDQDMEKNFGVINGRLISREIHKNSHFFVPSCAEVFSVKLDGYSERSFQELQEVLRQKLLALSANRENSPIIFIQ